MPEIRVRWFWNQWVVGVSVDYGRFLPTRWLIISLGPCAICISMGRRPDA